jgi:CRISPR-associated exonuclease Cas4
MDLQFALTALILALILFFFAARKRRAAGLPGGKVVYSDTGAWEQVEKPLYDPITEISGRPDYLIKQGKTIIPVEVKSGRTPESPYDSHIYQLAAYCLLVEREYGKRPPYGIIHYQNRTFSVDYTQELERALLDLLTEMRQDDRRRNVPRSHEVPGRCRGCGFAYICDQAL